MTVAFSTNYIAPAARVSNAWDTKVGGTLADALTCNAVVKSFGAEAREDARLAGVIGRWRTRVRRTWLRYNYTSTAQLAVLLCFRGSVIGGAILLWIAGRATPGDVTYVLTSYYIIHAYLRDVGMHINNLQRSVNDMEELVAIHGEPIGIADAPDAQADRHPGRRASCSTTSRSTTAAIARRCMTGCRWTSAPASASAWSAAPAPARPPSSSWCSGSTTSAAARS